MATIESGTPAHIFSRIGDFVSELGRKEYDERIKPNIPKLNERPMRHIIPDTRWRLANHAGDLHDTMLEYVGQMMRAMNTACLNCHHVKSGTVARPDSAQIEIQVHCDSGSYCEREVKIEDRRTSWEMAPTFARASVEPKIVDALSQTEIMMEGVKVGLTPSRQKEQENKLEESGKSYESFGSWS